VHGITGAEHPSGMIPGGVRLIDLTGSDVVHLDRHVGIADHLADPRQHRLRAGIGLAGRHVVAPSRDPLRPWPDGPQSAHADLAVARPWCHDPVQDARPVLHIFGQVGAEKRIDGRGATHPALDGQAELVDYAGSGTVGADETAAANDALAAGELVPHQGGNGVVVLGVERYSVLK
jgi:hypothetical protein